MTTNDGTLPLGPGWNALDQALAALYGAQESRDFGTIPSARLGGDPPLEAIRVFRSSHGTPHWHFVTYGLSELFEKESDDPEWSGCGFELSLRVIDPEHEAEPPVWALHVLTNLATYVLSTGNLFAAGHHLDLNGPIALGRETAIDAIAFALDPELSPLTTPNGRVELLQIVGLTRDEYVAVRDWDTSRFLELVRAIDPLLVTDLARASRLADPSFASAVRAGVEGEGSSQATLFVPQLTFRVEQGVEVLVVGAKAIRDVADAMRSRLDFGRELALAGPQLTVTLAAGDETSVAKSESALAIVLDREDRAAIARIPARRGDYELPSERFLLRVVPTAIKGSDGSVVEVVG